jgi:HPt (histidine-containing phosphotransfer) domain-containing protein
MSVLPPDILAKLQADYVASFSEKTTALEDALGKQDKPTLRNLAHKLAGSGATYAMPEITKVARAIETYIDKCPAPDMTNIAAGLALLKQIFHSRKKGASFLVSDDHPVLKNLNP